MTFDTGVLIALERRHAGALALLKACRLSRAIITIPAAVIAEWWRGSHRALLDSALLEALSPELGQAAGLLLAASGGSNAVDACVMASAATRGDVVATGDADDMLMLSMFVQNVTIVPIR